MQDAERKRANLRLLQRLGYATAESRMLDTATHCVLYEFVDTCWQKADTEGALCVADPPTTLVILNRTAAEPFSLVVQPHHTMIQKEQGYLIVRRRQQPQQDDTNKNDAIYGFWFPDTAELDRMYDLLHGILVATPTPSRSVSAPHNRAATTEASESLKAVLGIPTATTVATHATTATTGPSLTAAMGHMTLSDATQPLDKRALQLALLSLMHDERFLDLLHAQYTKIVDRKKGGGGGGS